MAIPGYYSLLQRGSSGPDVALVQTWLNGVRDACTWYDALKADGKFGVGTQRAVQEFQLKNKMNMDGKVGQNTWNVLYTRYTAKHGLKVPYPGIVLHTGSSGGTVRLVQQKLNSLGERLKDDGKYGAATAAAVQRFQRRNSLTADGSVGCATWEKDVLIYAGRKTIWNGLRVRFGHIQRKNHFKFRDTGASADAPVSHFHRRGRNGKQQLSVFLFSLVARAAAAAL